MTKKDRWICKQYIDRILSDVEHRDRQIVDLWEQLTKTRLDVNRKLQDVRDRKDYEIWKLKKSAERFKALYKSEKNHNAWRMLFGIICFLLMWVMAMFYFC